MKLTYKCVTVVVTKMGITVLVLGAMGYAVGARINITQSIPLGLYWTNNQPITKGAYVLFCPPEANVFAIAKARGYIGAGYCPGDYGLMMKRVTAIPGDTVAITDEGVWVNAQQIPFSLPLRMDKAGRTLKRFSLGHFILAGSEVLLMSDVTAASFDSRYFGPIHRNQIKTVLTPVITW